MDTLALLKRNRLARKQSGQIIETRTAFFVRYYHTIDGGKRKQKCEKLADKSDLYRSKIDVQPLLENLMRSVNAEIVSVSPQQSLTDFVEGRYLPWVEETKAASTVNGYRHTWAKYLKPHIGHIPLSSLQTVQVTAVLTEQAKGGLGKRTLSHTKWFLSGVYVYAISSGVLSKNPVPDAQWLTRVARPKKQIEYSLDTVLTMLELLEPVSPPAAVAVALAYFAALRPAEIRGLKWEDFDGAELDIKRSVWRGIVGETKNESSAARVLVIEPLKGLLEKLRTQSPDGYLLQNERGNPLSMDSLNVRVIAPAMEKAGIQWRGFYPCRRGISSKMTDVSKNILNATGLLRHSGPGVTAAHYTKAQKDSVDTAHRSIETEAVEKMQRRLVVQ